MTEKESSIKYLGDKGNFRYARRRPDKPVLPVSPILRDLYQNCIESGLKVAKGHSALMSFIVRPDMDRPYFYYIPEKTLKAPKFAYNDVLVQRLRVDILEEMMPVHLAGKFRDTKIVMRYKDSLANNTLHHILQPHFSTEKNAYDVASPLRSEANRKSFLNCLNGKGENGTLFDKRDMILFSLENMEWQAAEAAIDTKTRCNFLAVVKDHAKDVCDVTQAIADLAVHLRDEAVPFWFKTGWKKALKASLKT